MTDRAREEIAILFSELMADWHIGKFDDESSPSEALTQTYTTKFLNLSFNGYTIADLIELAEKATEGKKLGVYCEDAELPDKKKNHTWYTL